MSDGQHGQHFLTTFGPHETLFNQLALQGREIICSSPLSAPSSS
jgi:hypothetical protein